MKDHPADDFAARLVRFREAKGWTQRDLGVAAGLDQGTISKFERRVKVNPELGTLTAIANALGITVADLYPSVARVAADEDSTIVRRLPRAMLDQLADERLTAGEIDELLAETARDGQVDYRRTLSAIRARAKGKIPTPATSVEAPMVESNLLPMPPPKPRRGR